ncbi:MAG: histidine phosphatase family protein, partial [Kurthia sp.]|nr:histidine phosphatase family protein [Kurthia sp.]
MDSTFTLTLVRHAKTQGNVERKYVGWTDEGIVEKQLPIIDSTVQIVYGSDLKRCEQTVKQYYPQATFQGIPAFRETNFGDFEMKTYEDLKEDEVYRAWIDDPLQVTPPNGESFQQFQQRV